MDSNLKARAQKIKLIIFDVDGVMTDGSLFIGDDGQEYKMFNTQDGLGMRLLKKSGIKLAIITGRNSNSVLIRAENIEVDYFYQGISNKKEAFSDLIKKAGLKTEECAFMGDDVVDLPPMLQSGLAITVPGCHDEVKKIAHFITEKIAGYGAVREACDLIMKAQGTYDAIIAPYFK
jgi:3-deoxy-D-manno-octulosonate 8-phosphate phosphatase (KDO 8-P phosphatase)